MDIFLAVVAVVAVAVAVSVVLAGATFVAARAAARRTTSVQRDCAERERRDPGVCGACLGERIIYEPRASGRFVTARFVECWRCHGTGRPPTTC